MAPKKGQPKGSTDIHLSLEHSIKFNKRKFQFTPKQRKLLEAILDPETKVIFISGPAGSSKTFMAIYGLLQIMNEDKEKDLLYVRSIAESADKGLGSLPGDITEKFNPFLMPLYDKISEIVSAGDAAFLKAQGKISAIPINYLRGANWEDKLVFADEAQNFTTKELTTLITRIGEKTKIIIAGDYMQSDIHDKTGFRDMMNKFNDEESVNNGILAFTFSEADIVRSKILRFIIGRLEKK